jgi:hypothetical protein
MFAFVVILSSCLEVPREGPVLEAALDFPAPPSARDFARFPKRRFYIANVKRIFGEVAVEGIVSRQTILKLLETSVSRTFEISRMKLVFGAKSARSDFWPQMSKPGP